MYFTADWQSARESLRHLADYAPTAAITGHGPPLRGERLVEGLRQLADHFDERAKPAHGRYRDRPAITDRSGVVDVPPPQVSAQTMLIGGVLVGAAIAIGMSLSRREQNEARARAYATLSGGDDVPLTAAHSIGPADRTFAQESLPDEPMPDSALSMTSDSMVAPRVHER
jgi:hypothetical protein